MMKGGGVDMLDVYSSKGKGADVGKERSRGTLGLCTFPQALIQSKARPSIAGTSGSSPPDLWESSPLLN